MTLGDGRKSLLMPHLMSSEWIDHLTESVILHFEGKRCACLWVPQEGDGLLIAKVLWRLYEKNKPLHDRLVIVTPQKNLDPELGKEFFVSNPKATKKNSLMLVFNHPLAGDSYPCHKLITTFTARSASNLIVACEITPARLIPSDLKPWIHFMSSLTPHDLTLPVKRREEWNGVVNSSGAVALLAKDPGGCGPVKTMLEKSPFVAANSFESPEAGIESWLNMIYVLMETGCIPKTDYQAILSKSISIHALGSVVRLLGAAFMQQEAKHGGVEMPGSYQFYTDEVKPQNVLDYLLTLAAQEDLSEVCFGIGLPDVGGLAPSPAKRLKLIRKELALALPYLNLDMVYACLQNLKGGFVPRDMKNAIREKKWLGILENLRVLLGDPTSCWSIGLVAELIQNKMPSKIFIEDSHNFCLNAFCAPTHPVTRFFLLLLVGRDALLDVMVESLTELNPHHSGVPLNQAQVREHCCSMVDECKEFSEILHIFPKEDMPAAVQKDVVEVLEEVQALSLRDTPATAQEDAVKVLQTASAASMALS